MKALVSSFGLGLAVLCGCAGGPTKDYYNPAVFDAKFKGPVTIVKVESVTNETERLVREGHIVIGSTQYGGKHPEAVELKAQAKRVGANHVIYSTVYMPPQPGSWSFRFGSWGGGGGSGTGGYDVSIVFLGKSR